MSRFVKGSGTAKAPFNSAIRDVLRQLIRDPRLTANAVKARLEKAGVQGVTPLRPDDLTKGPLGEALRYRLDIQPRRFGDGAGTSFVSVQLKENTLDAHNQFEEEIHTVSGVIEWDQVSGRDTDYIIRISARIGTSRAKAIMVDIGKLPTAKRSFMNTDFIVWKSGIVDNFSPDDFLEIEGEQDK